MSTNTCKQTLDRQTVRLLKLLAKNPESGIRYQHCGNRFFLNHGERQFSFPTTVVEKAIQKKQALTRETFLCISSQGYLELRAWLNPDHNGAYRGNLLESINSDGGNPEKPVTINIAESPLSRLYKRKTPEGSAYISADEYRVGERLRADFEKGQLQQSITASWQAQPVNARRSGSDKNDISNFAMDARNRVSRAVDCLGPELSGVALDVCCFLKGLERVEMERRWPPRSAKLMLRTGLSMLSRHYGFSRSATGGKREIQQWGTADYRPSMKSTKPSGGSL